MATTSCNKNIWRVVFKDSPHNRSQNVAAYNLSEVLSYFTKEAHDKIVEIKETEEKITYHY